MDENEIYIKDKILKELKEYCKLNDIEDVNDFVNKCVIKGFTIAKFGTSPMDNINRENNGIKGFEENVKGTIKQEPKREGGREGERINGIEESKREGEETVKAKEKKENIKVRKIRVINKD